MCCSSFDHDARCKIQDARHDALTSAAHAPDDFYVAPSEFLFTVMNLAEMGLELTYRLIGFLNRKDRKDRKDSAKVFDLMTQEMFFALFAFFAVQNGSSGGP